MILLAYNRYLYENDSISQSRIEDIENETIDRIENTRDLRSNEIKYILGILIVTAAAAWIIPAKETNSAKSDQIANENEQQTLDDMPIHPDSINKEKYVHIIKTDGTEKASIESTKHDNVNNAVKTPVKSMHKEETNYKLLQRSKSADNYTPTNPNLNDMMANIESKIFRDIDNIPTLNRQLFPKESYTKFPDQESQKSFTEKHDISKIDRVSDKSSISNINGLFSLLNNDQKVTERVNKSDVNINNGKKGDADIKSMKSSSRGQTSVSRLLQPIGNFKPSTLEYINNNKNGFNLSTETGKGNKFQKKASHDNAPVKNKNENVKNGIKNNSKQAPKNKVDNDNSILNKTGTSLKYKGASQLIREVKQICGKVNHHGESPYK